VHIPVRLDPCQIARKSARPNACNGPLSRPIPARARLFGANSGAKPQSADAAVEEVP
jgi:hypothetical protein